MFGGLMLNDIVFIRGVEGWNLKGNLCKIRYFLKFKLNLFRCKDEIYVINDCCVFLYWGI